MYGLGNAGGNDDCCCGGGGGSDYRGWTDGAGDGCGGGDGEVVPPRDYYRMDLYLHHWLPLPLPLHRHGGEGGARVLPDQTWWFFLLAFLFFE